MPYIFRTPTLSFYKTGRSFFIAKNKLTKPKLQFYSVYKPTKTTAAPC